MNISLGNCTVLYITNLYLFCIIPLLYIQSFILRNQKVYALLQYTFEMIVDIKKLVQQKNNYSKNDAETLPILQI